MKQFIFVIVLMLSLTGCASVQFVEEPYVLIGDVDVASLKEDFSHKVAINFKTVSALTFFYKYQGFAGIGYTKVDEKDDAFAVACLNPAGIKIFEVKGSKDGDEEIFFQKQFKKYGDAAGAVAKDIRRIYFRRIPSTDASVNKKKREVVFTESYERGKMEYVFAGVDNYLVEKRYKEKGRKVWTVYYASYKEKDGKVHPWRILLKHHKYGYVLKVVTKELDI
jgi:hypothetical protein